MVIPRLYGQGSRKLQEHILGVTIRGPGGSEPIVVLGMSTTM